LNWKGKRVLVTGGTGFLGWWLTAELGDAGADVLPVGKRDYDLRDYHEARDMLRTHRPDVVFHLAGFNGGIKTNRDAPHKIYADNTAMAVNVVQACVARGVDKLVGVVASCAYPAWSDHQPMALLREEEFFAGPPHPSVACHGYAKRNLQLACSFAARQHGLDAVCVCPTTLYGQGMSYHPDHAKVVGAMVKRFADAADSGASEVTCWGTGEAMREVLHAGDCARLMMAAAEYSCPDVPLNLGSGQEFSVRQIAETVAGLAGYKGEIRWDGSGDGQRRKRLSTELMTHVVGRRRFIPFEEGVGYCLSEYRRWRR
jgi:nucleoside-diphosphate-sugar epimerase